MSKEEWYTTTFTVPRGTKFRDKGELYYPSIGQYIEYRNIMFGGNKTGKTESFERAILNLLRPKRHRLKIKPAKLKKALENYRQRERQTKQGQYIRFGIKPPGPSLIGIERSGLI